MELTDRSWGVVALVVALAVLGVVFAAPVLFVGALLVASWLLARQYSFLGATLDVADALEVRQTVGRPQVKTEGETAVTLAVSLEQADSQLGHGGHGDEPTDPAGDGDGDAQAEHGDQQENVALERDVSFILDVSAGLPPVTASSEPLETTLPRALEEPEAVESPGKDAFTHEVATQTTWPVTGQHRFDPATVSLSDGWFRETFTTGNRPTVTVEPRGPDRIHVGEGGDRYGLLEGVYPTERVGSGVDVAELREYQPSDAASRIDWKATARLAKPHVREYEVDATRRTLLVVDHRDALGRGPPDETKLDCLRAVALAITRAAADAGDPLGLLTVGEAGVTTRHPIATGPEQYRTVRRVLYSLEVEGTDDGSRGPVRGRWSGLERWPALARGGSTLERAHPSLFEDDSAFARTLRPFYANRNPIAIDANPLYRGLRSVVNREPGSVWTVILTDDSALEELHETVGLARADDRSVLVALAPTVLYESGGFDSIEAAFDQYRTFERHRRALGRMDRVTALEVAPADRLSTVLSGGSTRRPEVRP